MRAMRFGLTMLLVMSPLLWGCAGVSLPLPSSIQPAAEIAAKNNRPVVIMQTTCPQEISLARIAKRTKENYESNALTEQAYLNNKAKFEPVDLEGQLQLRGAHLGSLYHSRGTQPAASGPAPGCVLGWR